MNDRDQINAFAADLDKLVSRYCDEWSLSTAAAVGVLEIKKQQIITNALSDDE